MNELFYREIADAHDVLDITVYDEDKRGAPEFLGRVMIPLLHVCINYFKDVDYDDDNNTDDVCHDDSNDIIHNDDSDDDDNCDNDDSDKNGDNNTNNSE